MGSERAGPLDGCIRPLPFVMDDGTRSSLSRSMASSVGGFGTFTRVARGRDGRRGTVGGPSSADPVRRVAGATGERFTGPQAAEYRAFPLSVVIRSTHTPRSWPLGISINFRAILGLSGFSPPVTNNRPVRTPSERWARSDRVRPWRSRCSQGTCQGLHLGGWGGLDWIVGRAGGDHTPFARPHRTGLPRYG